MITDSVLFKYLGGELAGRDKRMVDLWLREEPGHQARLDALRSAWEEPADDQVGSEAEAAWLTLEPKLRASLPGALPAWRYKSRKYIAVAATLLILIGTSLFLLLNASTQTIRNRTLATKTHLLPDGSEVSLGPGSKLTYKKSMTRSARLVSLTGEAFFDVKADPKNPFTVKAGTASIEVTGTRFVVNASRNSNEIEVSVRTGKVLFYTSNTMTRNAFRMGLGPGEKGIYRASRNQMDKTLDPGIYSVP